MKKFSKKLLLATDMDGTLLTTDKHITQENLDAIERFIKAGGIFTIATGRSLLSALKYLDKLSINVPLIVFNGGAIYDLKTEQRIWEYNLPDSAHDCVKDVIENFPTVGIEMLKDDDIFVPVMTDMIHDHVVIEKLKYTERKLEDIPKGCIKALFAADEKTMDNLISHINQKGYEGLNFLRSAKEYYEILPAGVTKGSALVKLCEILDVDIKNTIAIGDYNNDMQMIMNANLGVAVANAPQEVKDCADFVTVSNDENAVAAVIDKVLNEWE